MPNILLEALSDEQLLDFSRYFPINRPGYMGDVLFPNVKTENLVAEYYLLSEGATLPTIAPVHALDTEAVIGTRPTIEKNTVEKLFVKKKINMSERVQMLKDTGVYKQDALLKYVFDDLARLAEDVKARTEVMKMELLCTGKITVNENGLNYNIDFGMSNSHKAVTNWESNESHILADIQDWVDQLKDEGYSPNKAICSQKVFRYISTNKEIAYLLTGESRSLYVPMTLASINGLFNAMFGITLQIENEGKYKYEKADGTTSREYYFEQDKFILLCTDGAGTIGTGLWGATPEELGYGSYSSANASQFITATRWASPDPVAIWTKVSGLMIPVLPNPDCLFIAEVDDAGADLESLTIGSLTLSPTFSAATTSYTATTSNATNTITAVAKDEDTTITITNGSTNVANGSSATWVANSANTVTVKVDNDSGTTKTYTVTVTHASA